MTACLLDESGNPATFGGLNPTWSQAAYAHAGILIRLAYGCLLGIVP
jgi:hypothetical protein